MQRALQGTPALSVSVKQAGEGLPEALWGLMGAREGVNWAGEAGVQILGSWLGERPGPSRLEKDWTEVREMALK